MNDAPEMKAVSDGLEENTTLASGTAISFDNADSITQCVQKIADLAVASGDTDVHAAANLFSGKLANFRTDIEAFIVSTAHKAEAFIASDEDETLADFHKFLMEIHAVV